MATPSNSSVVYVLTSGCKLMHMPVKYSSYKTAWDRFKRWSVKGVWVDAFKALIDKGYSMGRLSLDRVAVDGTTIKARKGGKVIGYDGYKHIKGTKIHVVVSPESLPLSVQIGPGNEHDSKHFIKLL